MFDFDNITITVILSAVSFLAGFIDSIAGGGGLLLLPSLLLAGLPPQVALGTMKFASSIGTGAALINFILKKKVVWKIAASGIAFSLLGSFIGTKTILIFNNETAGRIIIFLLPLAMLITAAAIKTNSIMEIIKELSFTAIPDIRKIPVKSSIQGSSTAVSVMKNSLSS